MRPWQPLPPEELANLGYVLWRLLWVSDVYLLSRGYDSFFRMEWAQLLSTWLWAAGSTHVAQKYSDLCNMAAKESFRCELWSFAWEMVVLDFHGCNLSNYQIRDIALAVPMRSKSTCGLPGPSAWALWKLCSQSQHRCFLHSALMWSCCLRPPQVEHRFLLCGWELRLFACQPCSWIRDQFHMLGNLNKFARFPHLCLRTKPSDVNDVFSVFIFFSVVLEIEL